jgi:phosphomannomutase/phosphoglucomutase
MFFNDYYFGYDDAIFASLRLVQISSREGKPLSSLASEIPYYYSTPEIRIDSTDEGKFDVVEAIKKEFSSNYSVIDIDGVRVNFGDGWGLVRASNTQPVLVLRFEAKTKKRLEEIQEMMMKRVEKINT